ncbi:hypothetical protein JCM10213_001136 [Rhodosporidiobolus nylandii]
MPPPPSQVGLVYLNHLDALTAQHHLSETANQLRLAALQGRDIAKRELEEGWHRFDRRMEDSTLLGSGPDGSAAEFTQWDGYKKAAEDAVHAGEHGVAVLKSQLTSSLPLSPPSRYASASTPALEKGISLHSSMAGRYAGYAAQDAEHALRQLGMAAGEVVEVGRRRLVSELAGEGKPHLSVPFIPSVLEPSSSPSSPENPLAAYFAHRDRARSIGEGLMNAAGVALDVGLGVGLGELAERKRRQRGA